MNNNFIYELKISSSRYSFYIKNILKSRNNIREIVEKIILSNKLKLIQEMKMISIEFCKF